MKKVTLFISFLSLPLTASAKDIDLFNLSLEELLNVKIYSSTKTSHTTFTSPSSVSVFSQEEIQSLGIDYLHELLAFVPGYQTFNNGGSGTYKTYSSRARRIGGASAEILIFIDGVRADNPVDNGAALTVSMMPVEMIERIEIIRGTGSALYGSNAMQGVINITTKRNEDYFAFSLGSFDKRTVSFGKSYQYNSVKVEALANLYQDNGAELLVWDNFTSSEVNTTDPKTGHSLKLAIEYKDFHYQYFRQYTESNNYIEAGYVVNDFNFRDSLLTSHSLNYDFSLMQIESDLLLAYKEVTAHLQPHLFPANFFNSPFLSFPVSSEPLIIGGKSGAKPEKSISVLWNNSLLRSYGTWVFGAEYQHNDVQALDVLSNYDIDELFAGIFPITYYPEIEVTSRWQRASKRDITSVYAQLEYPLTDKVNLTLGGRYDNYSDIGSHVSPRLAAIYSFDEQNTIKMMYGNAYRAPSIGELYVIDTPAFSGNPNLTPEVVDTYEVSYLSKSDTGSVIVNYFENHFTDSIVREPNQVGSLEYVNSPQEPVKGIEAELLHQLAINWRFRANLTHIFDKPSSSYREASETLTIALTYDESDWSYAANLVWRGKSETLINDSDLITLSDYALFNINIEKQINNKVSIYLKGKNIFDEYYLTPSENTSFPTGIENRGRELQLGFRYEL